MWLTDEGFPWLFILSNDLLAEESWPHSWHWNPHLHTHTHTHSDTHTHQWATAGEIHPQIGRRTTPGFSGTMDTEKRRESVWLGQGVLPSSEEHTGCIQCTAKQCYTMDQQKKSIILRDGKIQLTLACVVIRQWKMTHEFMPRGKCWGRRSDKNWAPQVTTVSKILNIIYYFFHVENKLLFS